MSSRSLRKILHFDLKFHPYKILLAQELTAREYANCRNACEQMLQQIPATTVLVSSDKYHFHLTGAVNKQNLYYWAQHNPQEHHKRPPHCPKAVSYTHLDVYKRQTLFK